MSFEITAEGWILICFTILVIITHKKIIFFFSDYLKSEENKILALINNAKEIHEKAHENLEDAKKMLGLLEETKSQILVKEKNQLDYYVKAKHAKFNEYVEARNGQFDSLAETEIKKFKNFISAKIVSCLKEKLSYKIQGDEKLAKQFTDLSLSNTKLNS
jgi:F0F1-type ATP synthase membrane subunit b/b'